MDSLKIVNNIMKIALRSTACILPLIGSFASASAQQPSASNESRSFDFMGKMTITILLAGADSGGSSALLEVRVPPNSGPLPHIHTREDEVYVIKQGVFQFFMDGTCIEAGPGAIVYMPKGHMHAWKNISNQTGEQLMFVYPAGLEQFFREVQELGLKMPQDFDKMNELSNRKYGINYVPGYDFHTDPEPKIELDKIKPSEVITGPYTFYVPPYSYYYFHHMDKLGFHLDWVRRAGPIYPLPEAKKSLTANYTYQGQQYNLEDYYKRNAVLGFLVLKDGKIITERYFYNSDQNSKFLSMSVQKSITSTLFGIAVEEGLIPNLDDPVTKYLPDLSESGYNRVNIRDVLKMATGINAGEDSTDPNSNIHAFNEMTITGVPSFYDYLKALKAKPDVKPGTVFDYQTVNTEVLGLIIEKASGKHLNEYMQEKLWSKLGAEGDAFIFRAKKQPDQGAYGCMCATLRDYGRFGLLMLNGGTLGANRVVSKAWVAEATAPQKYSVEPPATGGYGYQWWTLPGNDGAYQAAGIFGQVIYINPAKNIVIVETSAWPTPDPDERWGEMSHVINAIVAEISQ